MLNINKILQDDRTCKALTGLSVNEVKNLLKRFEEEHYRTLKLKPNRKRDVGGGRKGKLSTMSLKLLFILVYLKVYPTFDLMSVLTNRSRSKCCESVHKLLPILEKVLGKALVLPKRKVRSLDEFCQKFGDVKDLFIDGSERPVQRPCSQKQQKKLYSGKKKSHTRKNIIACNDERKILIMTPTKSGRKHDKRLLDKSDLIRHVPKNCTIWADTGFEGIQHGHNSVEMPKKKPKGGALSQSDKENNKVISSFRVVVEHAIGGYKRYKSASDIYRNRTANFDDKLHLVTAGLWNFHLDCIKNIA